jgi:hypothetical protein
MSKLVKALAAAAGNAASEPDTGLQWAVSANGGYTRIYSLDEETDEVSEVDLTSDIESAYGADWSHDQSILYTVEDISGTTYFRAWDWTNGRQGSLIAQTAAPAAAGSFCQLMCNRGMGAIHDVEMLGYFTDSNRYTYIVVFDGTSFTTTGTINSTDTVGAFRNLSFSQDGSAVVLGQYRLYWPATWHSISTSGVAGGRNRVAAGHRGQHAVFSQYGSKILIADNNYCHVYNKVNGDTPSEIQVFQARGTGCDCNSDGLAAWNEWGVGWFNESSGFTPFSTYPSQFATYFEISISDSNLVDNNIRYILCHAYGATSRIYKVNTNLQTVTDLGAPYSGNLNVSNIRAAR